MIPIQLTDFCLNGTNGLNLNKRDSVRFSRFFSFFHLFVETRMKLNKSCTKLQINQAVFGRVSVQQNYLYFSKVFKRLRAPEVDKAKIDNENTFSRDSFSSEGNSEFEWTNLVLSGSLCRVVTCTLTLSPRKRYTYVFWTLIGLSNFKPFAFVSRKEE